VDVDLFILYALLGYTGCYSLSTRVLPRGQSRLGVKVTVHMYLVTILRLSGVVPLLLPMCLNGVRRDEFSFASFVLCGKYVG
jgi:hypothetical protein